MDLGPKKYTSQIEVSRSTPALVTKLAIMTLIKAVMAIMAVMTIMTVMTMMVVMIIMAVISFFDKLDLFVMSALLT